jgi:hypothetical protein
MLSFRLASLPGLLPPAGAILLVTSSFSTMSSTIITRRFNSRGLRVPSPLNLAALLFTPATLEFGRGIPPVVRNKWTSGWDGNLFYCRVPLEQTTDVRGKGTYPLGCTMTPLDYAMEVTFECGPGDANVAAFTKATSIIGGRDAVEEFLACELWPLTEKFGFMVETKETLLSKVVVPMPHVTPIIGAHE